MTGGYGVVATCVFSVDGETWIPTHVSFSFIFLNYTIHPFRMTVSLKIVFTSIGLKDSLDFACTML